MPPLQGADRMEAQVWEVQAPCGASQVPEVHKKGGPAGLPQFMLRDAAEVEAEQKTLAEAIKNARERDRRTLLRAINKGKAGNSTKAVKIGDRSREGDLFPATSIDEYAELANKNVSEEYEDDDEICS